MNLLVGLGNYGPEYAATRHNVGFMVAELVADRFRIALKKKGYSGLYGVGVVAGRQTTIILPLTYMNRSGTCVKAAVQGLGIDPVDILTVQDDLDLPFGRMKISKDGGHGGHNGIRDIIAVLERRDFVRLKIGIGKPEQASVTHHVLGRFAAAEQKVLTQLLNTAADAVEMIIDRGVVNAMNRYNSYNLYENL